MYLASILLQSVVLGTQILMVAVALYVVYAASRVIHLATGAIGAAAAYGLWWGVARGWPLFAAILCGVVVAVALGIVSAKLLEVFSARREPLLGLLVSFAIGIILESLIAVVFGTAGKNLQTGILPVIYLRGVAVDLPGVFTIAIGMVLALFAWVTVHFTRAGRLLRSVAENPLLATSFGINNARVRYGAYMLAALVSAIVIGLTGWHTALTPGMGFHLVIAAFIALLMGGVNDLRGTVVASYCVAIIPGLVIGFTPGLSENWRLVLVFGVALIVLSLRPQGIFAKRLREA